MRKSLVATACLAATLTLAGCGATTAGSPAAAPAAAGAVAPTAFTTATDLATAVSAATKDKGSAKLAFTAGLAGQNVTGTGAYSTKGDEVGLQMSMNLPQQGQIDLVLVDKTIYIKIPGAPGGKPWIKAPIDGSSQIGQQFSGFGDQLDISKQFDQLKQGGQLTGATPDTVDGTPATKYTVAIDTTKAAADGTEEEKQAMQQLAAQGVKTIDDQIWIDAANLPVRVSTSIPVQGQTTTFDLRYSDWGQPVDISAPAADQVTDAPN